MAISPEREQSLPAQTAKAPKQHIYGETDPLIHKLEMNTAALDRAVELMVELALQQNGSRSSVPFSA